MITAEIKESSIPERLRLVYGEVVAERVVKAIEKLIGSYEGRIPGEKTGWSEQDALLITYGDSIKNGTSSLHALNSFLTSEVGDLLSFVHLLPFYPYTSDDGFSVVDFREVREELGDWQDIQKLAENYRLVFDGVINHVSASSHYMRGYCSGDPTCEDFFIALDPQTDTSSVLRTRNLPLLHEYLTSDGVKWLWTTFSRDQVDLNFSNPRVLLEVLDVLLFYASQRASAIRLDAIPYLWKQLGTSCAHLPQTHELIKLIRDVYDMAAPHVILLTETNVPHRENVSYFGNRGDEAQMIYNFSLAPLIVWSLFKGDASVLSKWARELEFIGEQATYLNITATHDGIGMRPTEGILSESERAELVQLARDRGGDMTGKRNGDGSVSPYELNISYFDAINDPRGGESIDRQIQRFLVSQAIPMVLMGMPGIYIHSLLGSRNDLEGVKHTGRARSINRAQLDADEMHRELADSNSLRAQVFSGYSRLLKVRSRESGFHPDARQEILNFGPGIFAVKRHNPTTGSRVLALHNVTGSEIEISLPEGGRDLLGNIEFKGQRLKLAAYQICWLSLNS